MYYIIITVMRDNINNVSIYDFVNVGTRRVIRIDLLITDRIIFYCTPVLRPTAVPVQTSCRDNDNN